MSLMQKSLNNLNKQLNRIPIVKGAYYKVYKLNRKSNGLNLINIEALLFNYFIFPYINIIKKHPLCKGCSNLIIMST